MTDVTQRFRTYDGRDLTIGSPIGAIGTGYTILEGDGRLGQTTIFNHFPAAYTLEQPPSLDAEFLAFRPEGAQTRVLALRGSRTGPAQFADDVTYTAHFPFADLRFVYSDGIDVSLQAWSPFVPGDAHGSNIPVAVFDVEFDFGADLAGQNLQVAARFPRMLGGVAQVKFDDGAASVEFEHYGRKSGQSISVLGGTVVGAGATDLDSFVAGSWGDLHEASHHDLTVVTGVTLDSDGRASLSILHAWYYPDYQIGSAFPYSHMYGRTFAGVDEVAEATFSDLSGIRRRSLAWQERLSPHVEPDWLADNLVNSLYNIAKNSWWNVDDNPDSSWQGAGLFTLNETFRDCPVTNTIPCHYFAHFPVLWLFPELEKTTLDAFARYQLMTGEIPFALAYGSGLHDPRYHCVHPSTSAMYVELLARYYWRTGDRQWMESLLPTALRALEYIASLDFDGDGLIEERPHALPTTYWPANNYHDAFPWAGIAAHTNGIWLSALAAFRDVASDLGATDEEKWASERLAKAQSAYEGTIWNGDFYRMYVSPSDSTGEASLTNQLVGEWSRTVSGRAGVLLPERVSTAVKSIARLNVDPFLLPTEAVNPDGSVVTVGGEAGGQSLHQEQGSTCMVSEAICAAVTFISVGERDAGLRILERQWEAHAETWNTPFSHYYMLRTDTGEPVWGNDYLSNMVVWSALTVLDEWQDGAPKSIAAILDREALA